MNQSISRYMALIFIITGLFAMSHIQLNADSGDVFSEQDLLSLRSCRSVSISPDGSWIAYTLSTPRKATEKPGGSYSELFLVSTKTKEVKPFIGGKVSLGSLQWSPDGKRLAFTTRRGNGKNVKNQVWIIPVDGGEAVQGTFSKTGVGGYQWHPKLNKIAYTAMEAVSDKDEKLKEKGYGFIYYEEKLRNTNLYIQDIGQEQAEQLTKDFNIGAFVFSPDGKSIALSASKMNLVDHNYMFRKVYVLDLATKKMEAVSKNEGKLGNYVFSPDGSKLAYTSSFDRKDHAVSQAFVVDLKTKEVKNVTIPDFRGHVSRVYWKDAKTVAYVAGEGVWPTLSIVPAKGGERKVLYNSKDTGVTFRGMSFSKDFKHAAFSGSSATSPSQLYYFNPGKKNLTKMTDLNPWLTKKKLGKQEAITYNARDGLEIEGVLIYPVDYKKGQSYPLVVLVHGGPEAHYSNAWVTRYAEPGQVLANNGYAVFYPNYRASTGYGVKFALGGYKDAAGKEFDDIADGIDHLVKIGLADKDRVGLGGGSYGGYAAAWFGSYYTKKVRAVCMFVGISNLISKHGTTDIPYEELYVHSGDRLEDSWDFNLKRSPIYYAHQSQSAVFIFGGAADTRVHPSQSMEFFRRLKMNDHPAVRLVQYPGEGHGNRRQPGQIDVLYRVVQWFDWYVKDKKPLKGPMPPLDISEHYGLDLK